MKSPADTTGARSESGDDEGPAAEADPADADADADAKDASDEECVETVVDDESGGDGDRATSWWQGQSRVRWIAAVVLVAVLAVAGVEGWQLFQHHQKDVAAAQALDAAEKFTLTLTTIDPNAIDANITDVLDGSTGEFNDLYQQSSEQLRQVLIDNKAAAQGVVIDSAVKSATKNRVEVVLFIDQVVSNAASPEPQLDRSRVIMTMEKVDGRWLASKVDLP